MVHCQCNFFPHVTLPHDSDQPMELLWSLVMTQKFLFNQVISRIYMVCTTIQGSRKQGLQKMRYTGYMDTSAYD